MIACLKVNFHMNLNKLIAIELKNFRANKLSEKVDFVSLPLSKQKFRSILSKLSFVNFSFASIDVF